MLFVTNHTKLAQDELSCKYKRHIRVFWKYANLLDIE